MCGTVCIAKIVYCNIRYAGSIFQRSSYCGFNLRDIINVEMCILLSLHYLYFGVIFTVINFTCWFITCTIERYKRQTSVTS